MRLKRVFHLSLIFSAVLFKELYLGLSTSLWMHTCVSPQRSGTEVKISEPSCLLLYEIIYYAIQVINLCMCSLRQPCAFSLFREQDRRRVMACLQLQDANVKRDSYSFHLSVLKYRDVLGFAASFCRAIYQVLSVTCIFEKCSISYLISYSECSYRSAMSVID